MLTYTTIAGPATAEFRDRGSKFLAYAYPLNSVDEVKSFIAELKKEHPKAVHHCYAYRMGIEGRCTGLMMMVNPREVPAGLSWGRSIVRVSQIYWSLSYVTSAEPFWACQA